MTLIQLQYIVAVHNYKNFALAAEKCFVTQPTLSMQIQKLESELGVLIFDRSKQPVRETEIGSKIIAQAKEVLKSKDEIFEIIHNLSEEVSGDFRLGIIPTVAPYLLPFFIENFINKYPKINLIIDELQTNQIVDKLRKDELDAGILATPLYQNDIRELHLYYEPFVGYVSEKHKLFKKKYIKAEDLKLHDLWLLKEGHCFRDHVIQICSKFNSDNAHSHPNLNFESGTMETLMKLVENNFGMTLVPYLLAYELKGSEKEKYLKSFKAPIPKREISLVFQRTFLKKKIIKLLESEIKTVLPDEVKNAHKSFLVDVPIL